MNVLSMVGPLPALRFSKNMVRRWFNKCGGKLKTVVTKPLITKEQKLQRVKWAVKWKHKIDAANDKNATENLHVAFLDEKWFYTRSRRRKQKYLPAHSSEPASAAELPTRRERSRRYPTKVMFLGVVARPEPENSFSGLVYIRRISESHPYTQRSYSTTFCDDYFENGRVRRGWKNIDGVNASTSAKDLQQKIGEKFVVDGFVLERIVLRYQSWTESATPQNNCW